MTDQTPKPATDSRYGPCGDAPTLQQSLIRERDRYKDEAVALRAEVERLKDALVEAIGSPKDRDRLDEAVPAVLASYRRRAEKAEAGSKQKMTAGKKEWIKRDHRCKWRIAENHSHAIEPELQAEVERLREKLGRVADWIRFAANSPSGIVAEVAREKEGK